MLWHFLWFLTDFGGAVFIFCTTYLWEHPVIASIQTLTSLHKCGGNYTCQSDVWITAETLLWKHHDGLFPVCFKSELKAVRLAWRSDKYTSCFPHWICDVELLSPPTGSQCKYTNTINVCSLCFLLWGCITWSVNITTKRLDDKQMSKKHDCFSR